MEIQENYRDNSERKIEENFKNTESELPIEQFKKQI